MFKLLLVCATLSLAYGKSEIGFGSFQKTNPKFGNKVVGGTDARLGQFPYQVSLQLKGPTNSNHYCGGSIITPNTVVTAGHCVTEVNIGIFQHIEVRAAFVSLDTPGIQQQSRKVIRTIVHPDFPGGVAPNDIAIHIVDAPFNLNLFAGAIRLPSNDSEATGVATLSGWGSTSQTSNPVMPEHLQTVELQLISSDECAAALEGSDAVLEDGMICTQTTGSVGACSGDSGGPLATGPAGSRVLTGIVSWGFIPCGQEGLPSVFTEVAKFVDFINENKVD